MDITRFIPARNLDVLRRAGLHKVAGAMCGVEEMTLKEAVAIGAAQMFVKNAEYRVIREGLESLAALRGEKTAEGPMDLIGPLLLRALPGAAIGGLGAYAASPNDPDAELRNIGMGAGIGGIAGLLRGLHLGAVRDPPSAAALGQAIRRPL